MKKFIISIAASVMCLFQVSCSDWLTIQPADMLSAKELFTTEEGFQDALVGAYISLAEIYPMEGNNISGFIEHIACQWDGYTKGSNEWKLNYHEYKDFDNAYGTMFKNMYRCIADVNVILDNIENGALSPAEYDRIKGECLAMRAFVHFDLIRLWGPIPFNPQNRTFLPYAEKIQINYYDYLSYVNYMAKLNRDLDEAERTLKNTYDARTTTDLNDNFFRYENLLALRSRVELWMGNKEKAVEYATKIYTDQNYKLGVLEDIVVKSDYTLSNEHLLTVPIESSSSTHLASNYIYKSNLENLIPPMGDIRNALYILVPQGDDVTTEPLYQTIKYNVIPTTSTTTNAKNTVTVPLIRLAEIYLIMIEGGDLTLANEVYKKFCIARGIEYEPVTEINRSSIIELEYRREFIAEGQLFYYYKRLGVRSMPKCNRLSNNETYILPLPLKEQDVNH